VFIEIREIVDESGVGSGCYYPIRGDWKFFRRTRAIAPRNGNCDSGLADTIQIHPRHGLVPANLIQQDPAVDVAERFTGRRLKVVLIDLAHKMPVYGSDFP
jgi:hypothetical protein